MYLCFGIWYILHWVLLSLFSCALVCELSHEKCYLILRIPWRFFFCKKKKQNKSINKKSELKHYSTADLPTILPWISRSFVFVLFFLSFLAASRKIPSSSLAAYNREVKSNSTKVEHTNIFHSTQVCKILQSRISKSKLKRSIAYYWADYASRQSN